MAITIGDALLRLGADTKDLDAAMAKVGDNIKKGAEKWSKQMRVVGAAFTAVGVAGLKLADDARKMNAALSGTAITLGITVGEMGACPGDDKRHFQAEFRYRHIRPAGPGRGPG
jgi:uncharacterized membrane protein YjjP (DUF1212 family)